MSQLAARQPGRPDPDLTRLPAAQLLAHYADSFDFRCKVEISRRLACDSHPDHAPLFAVLSGWVGDVTASERSGRAVAIFVHVLRHCGGERQAALIEQLAALQDDSAHEHRRSDVLSLLAMARVSAPIVTSLHDTALTTGRAADLEHVFRAMLQELAHLYVGNEVSAAAELIGRRFPALLHAAARPVAMGDFPSQAAVVFTLMARHDPAGFIQVLELQDGLPQTAAAERLRVVLHVLQDGMTAHVLKRRLVESALRAGAEADDWPGGIGALALRNMGRDGINAYLHQVQGKPSVEESVLIAGWLGSFGAEAVDALVDWCDDGDCERLLFALSVFELQACALARGDGPDAVFEQEAAGQLRERLLSPAVGRILEGGRSSASEDLREAVDRFEASMEELLG